MKLINEETSKQINLGDVIKTFRGELVTLSSFDRRRVYCVDAEGRSNEWFPQVINAKVVD